MFSKLNYPAVIYCSLFLTSLSINALGLGDFKKAKAAYKEKEKKISDSVGKVKKKGEEVKKEYDETKAEYDKKKGQYNEIKGKVKTAEEKLDNVKSKFRNNSSNDFTVGNSNENYNGNVDGNFNNSEFQIVTGQGSNIYFDDVSFEGIENNVVNKSYNILGSGKLILLFVLFAVVFNVLLFLFLFSKGVLFSIISEIRVALAFIFFFLIINIFVLVVFDVFNYYPKLAFLKDIFLFLNSLCVGIFIGRVVNSLSSKKVEMP